MNRMPVMKFYRKLSAKCHPWTETDTSVAHVPQRGRSNISETTLLLQPEQILDIWIACFVKVSPDFGFTMNSH